MRRILRIATNPNFIKDGKVREFSADQMKQIAVFYKDGKIFDILTSCQIVNLFNILNTRLCSNYV